MREKLSGGPGFHHFPYKRLIFAENTENENKKFRETKSLISFI